MEVPALKIQIGKALSEVQSTRDIEGCKDLARRIHEISVEVGKHDDSAVKARFGELVVSHLSKASELGFSPRDGEVKTYLGSVNQYDEGRGHTSCCTVCAQYFLKQTLSMGTGSFLEQADIDAMVREGFNTFESLVQKKKDEAVEWGVGDIAHSMDVNESNPFFGFSILSANDKNVLVKGTDGTTKDFLRETLTDFKGKIDRRIGLGGIIHSQDKSYAICYLQSGDSEEWVLFDSHGKDGGPAYVHHTSSQEKMVECLAELIEYVPCNIDYLTRSEKQGIEAGQNEFILYALDHKDLILLPERQKGKDTIKISDIKKDKELSDSDRAALLALTLITLVGAYRVWKWQTEWVKVKTKNFIRPLSNQPLQ